MTKLIHFTDNKTLPKLISRTQTRKHHQRSDKPDGLWVSVEGNGDGWYDWCNVENFYTERLACEYEVVLTKNANVLYITSVAELDTFTEKFGVQSPWLNETPLVDGVNWKQVAKSYQGIIITPYIWKRRLYPGSHWYYGWDCASGCIWDMTAIASIKLTRVNKKHLTADERSSDGKPLGHPQPPAE